MLNKDQKIELFGAIITFIIFIGVFVYHALY